jgi:hypothetical protein
MDQDPRLYSQKNKGSGSNLSLAGYNRDLPARDFRPDPARLEMEPRYPLEGAVRSSPLDPLSSPFSGIVEDRAM